MYSIVHSIVCSIRVCPVLQLLYSLAKNPGKLRIALISLSWATCQAVLDPVLCRDSFNIVAPELHSQLWPVHFWGRPPGSAGA